MSTAIKENEAEIIGDASRRGEFWFVMLLGMKKPDAQRIITRIREGLPFRSFTTFVRYTGMSTNRVAGLLAIPGRTMARRKISGRFESTESDRLMRLARVFGSAVDLFEGDVEEARCWLEASAPALAGATPWDYAATDFGARAVEQLIGRLEFGIPV